MQPADACSAFLQFAASLLATRAQLLLWSPLAPSIPTPGETGPISRLLQSPQVSLKEIKSTAQP